MTLKIVRRLLPDWGTTYGPAGDGPFPAVMVLHGSEGGWSGWSHRNAVMLAAHGFLAFPFTYSRSGNVWNAGNISDVPLDRTAEALDALRAFAPVKNDSVGLFGVSRGAEHALLVTCLMQRDGVGTLPDALAVHATSDVICGGFDARAYRDVGDPGWTAWDTARRAWTWQGKSDDLLPTTPIPVEKYAGPVFLSHGKKDTLWSWKMTERLAARLRSQGREPELHLYEDQDHVPDSEGENVFFDQLIGFFQRHLP
ncbi:thioesterase [Thalassospira profundimaris]|uniref:Thioesterase n=1 Tax=Thalassospira profundimaris TaxID=502049 RepID=A0A367X7C4_9PROT|nr:alpha/beta hydrolase [Thalassospira profundimaris]RCK48651.1 thioesterase [Thalassospira profundimaris]